jgi:hypothetical protein
MDSLRSFLHSSPSSRDLGTLVVALVFVGSLVPFADLAAAPLLIYVGVQVKAMNYPDRNVRMIGSTASGLGVIMGFLAVWSVLMIGQLFLPPSIS